MKKMLAAILAIVAMALPAVASADTSPLVNRVIVNDALQQQMQNQLNIQQTQLQTQRDISRASLQSQMQQLNLQMQYLLLQQQLDLLRIEQRAHAASTRARRHHKH
jgi:hypothetical protein